MLEVGNMQQHGVAIVCHTEQLDTRIAALEGAFFSINLLERKSVGFLVEVIQTRSSPMLVLL
jgi:hypothetical protein